MSVKGKESINFNGIDISDQISELGFDALTFSTSTELLNSVAQEKYDRGSVPVKVTITYADTSASVGILMSLIGTTGIFYMENDAVLFGFQECTIETLDLGSITKTNSHLIAFSFQGRSPNFAKKEG